MIYIDHFSLPSQAVESGCFSSTSPTYYATLYPFQVFSVKMFESIPMDDITIFCGSNGSGKSTLLNIIAEKLGLQRGSRFNRTELYGRYVGLTACNWTIADPARKHDILGRSKIITSDDVFDHILDVRTRNENIDFKRQVILDRRAELRYDAGSRPKIIDMSDPDSVNAYVDYADMMNKSASWFVKDRLGFNERTYSNGENAFRYFTDAIIPNGLYLLDEPENSLSAQLQIDLSDFILGMAKNYGCQFIISSHSPFVLATPYARIYDLDSCPVRTRRWTDLPNVRIYHEFFESHRADFNV